MGKNRIMKRNYIYVWLLLPLVCGCGDQEKNKGAGISSADSVKAQINIPPPVKENQKPPIINITDTLSVKRTVLYIRDSAATVERLWVKLPEILGFKLDAVIKKNKIKVTGRPMVWYITQKPPYFFEAGIPVDKKPGRIPGHVKIREIGSDSVTVAHFYGGYDLLPQAYEALSEHIQGRKRKLSGRPYEIYVDDTRDKDGNMKDPYKVQTDVVFPWK